MINYRIRRHFIPSPSTLALLWGGIAFVMTMSLCIGFMALSGIEFPGLALSYTGIVISPLGLLSAGIAVFLEKNNGPRSLLWGITTLVLLVVSLIAAWSLGTSSYPLAGIWVAFACCGPLQFIAFVCSIYFYLKTYPDFHNALQSDRAQRTREILMARSEVALTELSAEIDLEPNALIKFLDQLIGTNFISALYSLETGRIYSLAALLEKQRQMLAVIQARGRLNLFDLAKELTVPAAYIRQWLGSLTSLNKFSGFIDWKTNLVTSQQLYTLIEKPNCPNCGGVLTLAGQGVNLCSYCGTEIFLPKQITNAVDQQALSDNNPSTRFKASPNNSNPTLLQHLNNWAKIFRPKKIPRTLLLGLFGILVIGLVCSISALTTEPSDNNLSLALVIFGMFDLPVITILLIGFALYENHSPSQFALWFLASMTLGLSLAAVILAMRFDPSAESDLWLTSLIYLAIPILSLISIPVVYFGLKAWPEISTVINTNLKSRMLLLVKQSGEISFADLATKLNISIAQVDDILDELLKNHLLAGTLNTRLQRIYTTETLAEKHVSLLILVRDRGQMTLNELSERLEAPVDLVQSWIYQLVQMGSFKGYINWNEGRLYSTHASKLADTGRCPTCGGSLKPGPDSSIYCQHCGCEIMI